MQLKPCAVCEGRYTVDTLIELRLGPPLTAFTPVPLCPYHYALCEGGIYDMRHIKTPPCIINVAAVGSGAIPGRIS